MKLVTASRYVALLLAIGTAAWISLASGAVSSQSSVTGLSGEGELFKVISITQANGGLEIQLAAKVERIEVVGEPRLVTSSGTISGERSHTQEGGLRVKFHQVPGSLEGAVLEIPGASVELSATTSSPLASGVILGPAGQQYTIMTLVSDKDKQEFQVHYQPENPSDPSVRRAVLRAGEQSAHSTGVVSIYDIPKQQFIRGVIYFPLDSAELATLEEVVLEVTLFRELVTDTITLRRVE